MTTRAGRSRKFKHVIEIGSSISRRDFIRGVAGTAVALGTFPFISTAADAKRSAIDRVALGRTKIKITRSECVPGVMGAVSSASLVKKIL